MPERRFANWQETGFDGQLCDTFSGMWQGKSTSHFGKQGNEIDSKFSLGEEDIESTPPARATGVSQPQSRSRINTS